MLGKSPCPRDCRGNRPGAHRKTTVLLTDLGELLAVNEVYARYFSAPFPARACYQVAALPKGAAVEIEAVIAI